MTSPYNMRYLFISVLLFLPTLNWAQSFSAGKNLSELRQAVDGKAPLQSIRLHPLTLPEPCSFVPSSRIFLPRWSPDALPLFCKIEHKMGQKMAFPIKFRLGSVEYVDQLEYPGRWGW